jgi:hypothetical protein
VLAKKKKIKKIKKKLKNSECVMRSRPRLKEIVKQLFKRYWEFESESEICACYFEWQNPGPVTFTTSSMRAIWDFKNCEKKKKGKNRKKKRRRR